MMKSYEIEKVVVGAVDREFVLLKIYTKPDDEADYIDPFVLATEVLQIEDGSMSCTSDGYWIVTLDKPNYGDMLQLATVLRIMSPKADNNEPLDLKLCEDTISEMVTRNYETRFSFEGTRNKSTWRIYLEQHRMLDMLRTICNQVIKPK